MKDKKVVKDKSKASKVVGKAVEGINHGRCTGKTTKADKKLRDAVVSSGEPKERASSDEGRVLDGGIHRERGVGRKNHSLLVANKDRILKEFEDRQGKVSYEEVGNFLKTAQGLNKSGADVLDIHLDGKGSVLPKKGGDLGGSDEVQDTEKEEMTEMDALKIIKSSEQNADKGIRNLKQKCDFLYSEGIEFELVKTGGTYQLASALWNERAYRANFTTDDLRFIQYVRKHIEDKAIALNFLDKDYLSEEIRYINVNKFRVGERIEGIRYIDISAAYWQTARNLGIIDEVVYTQGMKVDKVVRLAALGSLAKVKDTWKFDGKELKKQEPERSWATENLWFAICKKVSDVMGKVAHEIGSDFIFYWVDGIFIKKSAMSYGTVAEILMDEGYQFVTKQVPFVEFSANGFTVGGQEGSTEKDKHFSWDVATGTSSGKRGGNGLSVGGGKSRTPITDFIEEMRLLDVLKASSYNNKSQKKPKPRYGGGKKKKP